LIEDFRVNFLEIKDILDNVVAVLIFDHLKGVFDDDIDQGFLLFGRGMIKASLNDTATMLVGGDFHTLFNDRVVDELLVLFVHVGEAFLDDVVTIVVLNQTNNISREIFDHKIDQFLIFNNFNELLNSSGTMRVETDLNQFRGNNLNDLGKLFS